MYDVLALARKGVNALKYSRYLCLRTHCMQDTFARANTRQSSYAAARPSARTTIMYLVYKRTHSAKRSIVRKNAFTMAGYIVYSVCASKVSCI